MNKRIVLAVAAIALATSACNEDVSPTGVGRDLLGSADNIPVVGNSKYASPLEVLFSATTPVPDTIRIKPPVKPWKPGDPRPPGTVLVHEADEKTGNFSKYVPSGWVHIQDEHNRSQYKPSGTEHIKEGDNKTQYKPVGWEHYGGPPAIDNTKYLPPGYKHIEKGEDESKYYKPKTDVPADTVRSGTE